MYGEKYRKNQSLNMSKTLLLHTIGNRDWQFNIDIGSNEVRVLLEQNPENKEFTLVPIKSSTVAGKYELIFRDNTEKLVQIYKRNSAAGKELRAQQSFPMLSSACDYVLQKETQIDSLWLIATDQVPHHGFDTVHVAPIAEEVIMESFTTPTGKKCIQNCDISYLKAAFDKSETEAEVYNFFHAALRQKHLAGFDKMYFSCNTGMPDVTNILKILALREDNCIFLKHKVNNINGVTYTEEMYKFSTASKSWKE